MLTLSLNVDSVNTILTALNELPHKVARGIIDDIMKQAQAQEVTKTPSEVAEVIEE